MTEMENTSAYIVENADPLILKVSFLNIKDSKENPYLLVVKSASIECIRLTIYPIEKEKIIKISFSGTDTIENFLDSLSKILQGFKVLHTSGLLKKGDHFYYECYLNLNKSDVKYKDLIVSIDKIRYIFKEIKIEEIGLKKA
jgi:hypothetical protein